MLGYNELLKEECSYEKYIGRNKYNEKNYDSPKTIKCFTSFNSSNTLGYDEQNVSLKKIVFIDNSFKPNPFDKVDGLEIRQIKPVKGLITPIIGWEIVL